jgi:hypothetical protein
VVYDDHHFNRVGVLYLTASSPWGMVHHAGMSSADERAARGRRPARRRRGDQDATKHLPHQPPEREVSVTSNGVARRRRQSKGPVTVRMRRVVDEYEAEQAEREDER